MRNVVIAFFLFLPHTVLAQNAACASLQELLYSYIETAQLIATSNREMAQAAIANRLTTDDYRLHDYVISRTQSNIEILTSAMDQASTIVTDSGCQRD